MAGVGLDPRNLYLLQRCNKFRAKVRPRTSVRRGKWMRLFSMAILLVLFAAMGVNADAAQASQKQCHSNCVEVAQKPNGYTIKVRDGSGAVTYNQTIQSDARNPGPLVTEVIDTAGAVVPEADTTQTTTEAHPLPGGGSVIIITVRVNGVIVSTTVITVDRFGKVIEVTDV